ncbi:NADP-dependent malic enzyme [Candidatus Bandiella euplotis]|uniref:Bifunctional NADP-dependent malic enzyme/phosphotransacetylase n=1 Tax=Candidatus Bandiella euplotis TaxID=1664265 RepID=A0ABZ0UK03_9RICK|nr:NADP-dependent malic enzyme [Candidatus Bandiella woodruffii]WPX95992.1 Bifunctional NADP-dependent malic enzyme/phosphotransacetylase [Candidatus Bandiella woodruffii]
MNDLEQEALEFHAKNPKGKISIKLPKNLVNKHDLSLAYSPGVAEPCRQIHKEFGKIYDYTAKGNFVAVISNGTAVLGLGNLGAAASKPVMEGKAALFKRFADIDSIDIEVDETDPEKFVEIVKSIAVTWGGINLEDIKAPECFIIEDKLKECLNIPVFHDDQHGTAIVTAAGLINALHITKRKIEDVKIVVNGAGAAALACVSLIKKIGAKHSNIIVCDTKGVIYEGRTEGMNAWKEAVAVDTKLRTLEEAAKGADVLIGLSVKGAFSKEMIEGMASQPIIFAMANPDPEITPDEVMKLRPDSIIATGRSDYKNQVNNLMCFPYLFRGALDVMATTINDEMKIAAAYALANLAREEITEEVHATCLDGNCEFGPDYIIPITFDSRLMEEVSVAVAKAAMESGVARNKIEDFKEYRKKLSGRLNPSIKIIDSYFNKLKNNPKTVIFAEGEEDPVIKAAADWQKFGYGEAILVGRESVIQEKMSAFNISGIKIINAALSDSTQKYAKHLYQRHQRSGYIYRDCIRLVNRDRNVFAAEMLMHNEGDALITGITRNYAKTLDEITSVIDLRTGMTLFALSVVSINEKTLFVSDTAINECSTSEMLADIAIQSAAEVKKLGIVPKVALISASNFGSSYSADAQKVADAVRILDLKHVDFEYEGEVSIDVALNPEQFAKYPFCRLTSAANILIMPSLHSADIAVKLLSQFGDARSIGPILCGLTKSVQILPMNASVADILNFAAIAVSE